MRCNVPQGKTPAAVASGGAGMGGGGGIVSIFAIAMTTVATIMVNLIMITPAADDTFTIVTVIMLVDGPLVGVARLGGTHDVLQHHGLRPLHVDVLDHREELRRGGVVPVIGSVPLEPPSTRQTPKQPAEATSPPPPPPSSEAAHDDAGLVT